MQNVFDVTMMNPQSCQRQFLLVLNLLPTISVHKSSSSGKEFVALVVRDTFTGVIQAYPAPTKDSDHVVSVISDGCPARNCLVGGLTIVSLSGRCKAFVETIGAAYLAAGLAVRPEVWPVSCKYAATALSIAKKNWTKIKGEDFSGPIHSLGQLVFYRRKDVPKLSPNASPGLFAGGHVEHVQL